MRIFIDLDGVVFDLATNWALLYMQQHDPHTFIPTEKFIANWDVEKNYPGAYKLLDTPGLFANLPPIAGAVEAVRTIQGLLGEDRVYFLTNAASRYAASEKMECVERHFGRKMVEKVIVAKDKFLLRNDDADVLIDDSAQNTERWPGPAILFNAPHNVDYKHSNRTYRAKNWSEAIGMCKVLCAQQKADL